MGVQADMIINGLIFVLSNVLEVLLAPLEVINITVNFLGSIPFLTQFFQVIAYIMPWNNLIPLFVIVIAVIAFKIIISLVKTLWEILPFV